MVINKEVPGLEEGRERGASCACALPRPMGEGEMEVANSSGR